MKTLAFWLLALSLALGFAPHAAASFHLMQIEQVIGGVNGDTAQQAIQLRMRSGGQSVVQAARVVAYDSTGSNPVVVLDIGSSVSSSSAGDRILLTTADFSGAFLLPAADFTITNAIPPGYLAAGRLTFENDAGSVIYWSLCWGGASYTGPTTGDTTNDADGDFGPCVASDLPSSSTQALQFTGVAGALSTNNAADYSTTPGDATFTNNAGDSGSLPVKLKSFAIE